MNYKELLESYSEEDLWRFDTSLLSKRGVNAETRDFLSIIGLPKSAAPFLDFGHNESAIGLKPIVEIYGTDEFTHKYLLNIGSDGSGNPMCIDLTNNCQIVALNHEQEFEIMFVNTSVKELLLFLKTYKKFGEELIELNGEDAFLDSNFTDAQFESLVSKLKLIDESALNKGSFWFYELETLLANREYYRSEK